MTELREMMFWLTERKSEALAFLAQSPDAATMAYWNAKLDAYEEMQGKLDTLTVAVRAES